MKTNEIMKSVSLTFNKVGFQLQKKSPEILVAAGVVGVVVSAVMACQATPKALKVAEKTQDDVERIQGQAGHGGGRGRREAGDREPGGHGGKGPV